MNYCSDCGGAIRLAIPPDDNLERHICERCERIHYRNPKLIVGCLPVFEEAILLCRRAIEPRAGFWTLPSGFMENEESLEEGGLRETREEAGVHPEILRLHTVFSLPHISQVYMLFLARVTRPDVDPGPESLEARFFAPDRIPWAELAFRPIEFCLQRYLGNPHATEVHRGTYERKPGDPWILSAPPGSGPPTSSR